MSVVINVAFSVTLSNLVLLDSLIRPSKSFLIMHRSGGRRGAASRPISLGVPRFGGLAG